MRRFLRLIVVLALCGWGPRVEGACVGVIVSHDARPYELTLRGLRSTLAHADPSLQLIVIPARGDVKIARRARAMIDDAGCRAVVPLGAIATDAALAGTRQVPIIAGLLLRQGDLHGSPLATAVLLEFPVEAQLDALAETLPSARRLGILYNPEENAETVARALAAAEKRGFAVDARAVRKPPEIPAALDALAGSIDVLWAMTDHVVYAPETARTILLFSFRRKVPVFGLSSSWVESGALVAMERDYEDIGRQCAGLVLSVLNGAPVSSLRPVPPARVTYVVNMRTARQMNITLPAKILNVAKVVE